MSAIYTGAPNASYSNAPQIGALWTPYFSPPDFLPYQFNAGVTYSQVAGYPLANRANYYPIVFHSDVNIDTFFIVNGNTTSGNICFAIADSAGTRKLTTGSTAMTGSANAIQNYSVTATHFTAGLYFLCLSIDNTTATPARFTTTFNTPIMITEFAYQEASAFPVPSTISFATANATGQIYFIGCKSTLLPG